MSKIDSLFFLVDTGISQALKYLILSYDIVSGSEITPCNKIDETTSGL